MKNKCFRISLIAFILAVTAGVLTAQSSEVQVFDSRSAFELTTGAGSLPFPASATVLPQTPFAGFLDYSCVMSPPGISIPVNSTAPLANVQAPANNWICFLGPGWNGGPGNISPQPQSPTIVANGEDDYQVTFTAPVYAVGFELLTNSLAAEKVTLRYVNGVEQVFDNLNTAPNMFQFVGFKSMNPIASVLIDTTGGASQNEGITGIDAAFAVDIDIKPCSEPSPVNLKSNGAIRAAILGSGRLDVSLIDPGSVTLQGLKPKEPGNSGKLLCRIEDVAGPADSCGPDGFPDLVCHFQMGESNEDLTATIWDMRARTSSGVALLGFDAVKITPSTEENNGGGNGKPSSPPGQVKDKPGNNGNGNGNGNGNSNGNGNGNSNNNGKSNDKKKP